MKLVIQPSIDGTRILAPRPGRTKPGKGVAGFGILALTVLAIGWISIDGTPYSVYHPWFNIPAVLSVIAMVVGAGMLLWGPEQARDYEILLDAHGVTVDGDRMGHGVKMTMGAEKLVFHDEERQIEVWHGIREHDERMRLRGVLDQALLASGERQGEGQKQVPDALRQRE